MKLVKALTNLGYTTKQAEVYLATLSLGECLVNEIAKSVSLPRTSTASILEDLHNQGLVKKHVIGRKSFWYGLDPESVIQNFKKKEKDFEAIVDDLKMLQAMNNKKEKRKDSSTVEQLVSITNLIGKPAMLTDGDTKILHFNKHWEDLLGYKIEEIKGKMAIILLRPERVDSKIGDILQSFIKSGKIIDTDNLKLRTKKNFEFPSRSKIIPLNCEGKNFFLMTLI